MSRDETVSTSELYGPSRLEVDMLNYMNTQLCVKSPYKRFPPYGVPCPEGPMTLQLAIRREKWWEMLEDLAWRERLMMEREEAKKEEQKQAQEQKEQTWKKEQKKKSWTQEDHQKERKDSAGIIVVDENVAAKAGKSEPVREIVEAASAIYDSSEEEGVEEEEEEQNIPEQSKEVKVKKRKGMVKEKDKPHKYEHKIRRVRPLHNMRSSVTGGKGSASSHSSTIHTASH